MPATLQNRSHPCASTQVDWWSGTFQIHTDEHLGDLLAYLQGLGERILPGSEWGEPTKGRFYATRKRHPSGLQIQYTAGWSAAGDLDGRINEGLASVEIPGQIWGSFNPGDRRDLIDDLRYWPGLKRTTRLDLQTTILEPQQDAAWIVQEVAAGRLWPKGFGVGMAYANRNLHGDLHGACTQYFGGKESNIRSRHYDKAAEQGWQIPAVRHEVQLRNEPADQWFRLLGDRCQAEAPVGPLLMAAEASTVRDALGTLVDFRDTSRWQGRRKPKNWARDAQVPPWWAEIVGPAPTPLQVEYRPPGDLEATKQAALDQYGRKLGHWIAFQSARTGLPIPALATDFFLHAMAMSDEGDWKLLDQLSPGNDQAALREWFCTNLARAQAWAELTEEQKLAAPPS